MSNLIQVWPTKFHTAIKSLSGPHINKHGQSFVPELGHPYSVKDAMEADHESDAHMTLYSMQEKDGSITSPIPLMTKHILKEVRAEGCDLLLNAVALDWDTPGHIPLTPELLRDFLTKFLTACASDGRLSEWMCYHTTRHGCRVVYELSAPVKVDHGEQYITSIIKEFKRLGVNFDPNTRDWTRRFRLPKVVRDGLKAADEPMFTMQFQDRKLDVTAFKKSDIRSLVVTENIARSYEAPTHEDVDKMLYSEGKNGTPVQSEFYKKAKATIKQSTPYGDNLFDPHTPLCGDQGRNEAFSNMLGLIVPKMLEKYRAKPEQIFALFSGPLDALEVLPGKSNPRDHFWNFLQDIYEREHGRYIEKQEEKAEAVERGATVLERMVEGMQQWCDNELLFHEDSTVRETFVRSKSFANVGRYFYPMTEDGWYSTTCIGEKQLIPRIRETFLRDIIETEKLDVKGEPTSVSNIEIINNFTTVVNEIRMSPLQGVQGRIEDMCGNNPVLALPMYHRNDFLPAEPNPMVEGWLRALFGKHYEIGIKWIGYALDFEAGPICALSIAGAGGVGKKMLTEGLAECLVNPVVATGHDMVGSTNGAIMKTPFLVANEGIPKARDMSPSDTFKSLTAGDPIRVRELYKPPVNVINPMRLLFTANDHGPLREITKGKELTPQTRKAIGERLLHFDVDDTAEKYLKRLGGRSMTEKEGARWIRGENDQPSNFVVAKHFMYLYQTRKPRNPTDRYCVMGNCNESESFQIASQSEHLPPVIRGIVNLIENTSPLQNTHSCITKTGGVFVTMQGVYRQIYEVNQERCSERAMEEIIKSLMLDSMVYEMKGLHFKRLNPGAILDWAKPRGMSCPRLEEALIKSRD